MLKMLNTMYELFLDESILEDYALQLGSDCPFFHPGMNPCSCPEEEKCWRNFRLDLEGYHLFLVKPDQAISTREAYQLISPAHPERGYTDDSRNLR
jgi:4-diphosphocytidyl-2-C-methyl-D-erythritol kinase